MDPNVQRFTGFADLYDQYRPTLPLVIGEVLSQLAGSERPLRVVDLGSGTGLSTRLWKGFEATVIGIEPSPDMRVIAERLRAIDEGQSNISFKEGTSTNTGLAQGCADIVTVSQALHWMEPEPTFFGDCTHSTSTRGFRSHRLVLPGAKVPSPRFSNMA